MELIFDEIIIIDELNKKAKKQVFLPGINIVVSNGKDDEGNYIGKSTLLKSIFHALGADAFFPKDHNWEAHSKYFYILKFNLDSIPYKIMRCANVFYVYDKNDSLIFKCNERIKLSEFYSKLFGFLVLLKDNNRNKEYALAQPFSYFALNFVDQIGYKEKTGFLSFDKINQYTKIYGDLIFSQMGIDNEKLNKLYDEKNQISNELSINNEEQILLKKILNTLNIDENIPYEKIEVLKQEISIHKEEYDSLIKKYDLAKKKLFELTNKKSRILNEINSIKQILNNNESEKSNVLKKHICPLCTNTIENYTEVFFKKAYANESLSNQLVSYDSELIDIEKEINKEYSTYSSLYKEMEELEESIGVRNDDVNNIVKSIGLKEYKENIINKYNDVVLKLDNLTNSLKEIKKEITPLKKLASSINDNYNKIMKETMINYDISVFKYNDEKIDVPLSCSDPHVLFTAWLTSLYKLKRIVNPNGVFMPFVIDNPTDRDFEGDNYYKTLKMIFDLSHCCKQVITSKVVFDDLKFKDYSINKIVVDNKKYSLLNSEDYEYCHNERNKLQII